MPLPYLTDDGDLDEVAIVTSAEAYARRYGGTCPEAIPMFWERAMAHQAAWKMQQGLAVLIPLTPDQTREVEAD